MMREERLRGLLDAFPTLSLLVAGDFFLDQYLVVDPALAEVSLETGLTAHQIVQKRCSPGAAGTVVGNLASLGVGEILVLGVIGDDGEGFELKRGLHALGARMEYLIEDGGVFTPTYTKLMRREAGGEREMERLDIKNRRRLSPVLEVQAIRSLREAVEQVDGVIVADQVQERNCGVITDRVRTEVQRLAAAYPDKLFFADSRTRIGEFRGLAIKPNRQEAAMAVGATGDEVPAREDAAAVGKKLSSMTGLPVIVTLGAEGSVCCTAETAKHIPSGPVEGETDPVGAGDSTTAGIVSARCAGATWEEAALVGNLVASVTVQKLGTTGTASPSEVRAQLRRLLSKG